LADLGITDRLMVTGPNNNANIHWWWERELFGTKPSH